MAEFTGPPKGAGKRFAIIASRFNEEITSKLVEGARDALARHGAAPDDTDVVWVPGAWELPAAARRLLATERYDALVAVGAVIRGETPHFDYVAGEASRGLSEASRDFERPIGLMLCSVVHHVLDDDEADAVVRAWVDVLPRGSFVMLTHDIDPGGEHSALARRLDELLADTPLASVHRTRAQVEGYLAGLDLVEPGISLLHAWWPDGPRVRPLTPISYTVVGALARKP